MMFNCDYIPSNDILIDSKFEEIITSDLFESSVRFLFKFESPSKYNNPKLSNLEVVNRDGKLLLIGDVDIEDVTVFVSVNSGEENELQIEGTKIEYFLRESEELMGSIEVHAMSNFLKYSENYIVKYDYVPPVLKVDWLRSGENAVTINAQSSEKNATMYAIHNKVEIDSVELFENMTIERNISIQNHKGVLELYLVDAYGNKSNSIYYHLEKVGIRNVILAKSKTYIDGVDIMNDKTRMK